jgi:iron complex outermembrane receptor protein
MYTRKIILILVTVLASSLQIQLSAQGQLEPEELLEMSLEQLMNIEVTLASGVEESLVDAPAAMIVITSEDIRQRGYTNLSDVLMDLPGFDISVSNAGWYLDAHQRGYRTPVTARTLLMIDGKVDNDLWSNIAHISRQHPLTNVERIEVLYGPASAVYGANAFLGIINVITQDGKELNDGETSTTIGFQGGSFDTKAIDASVRGRSGDASCALSARFFRSDEPDLSDRWGFLSNEMCGNKDIWGPILDIETNGKKLGEYYDPTDDYGITGNIRYKSLKLGIIKWKLKEGYGTHFPADRGQSNARWVSSSMQLFLEHEENIFENVNSNTLLAYKESHYGGDWAEATPDWNAGMEDYSYISFTYWNCLNNSWLFRQNFEIEPVESLSISTGVKYERKELTKAYDVPGYWGAFSSSVPADDPGPYGHGFGIGHSTDSSYTVPPFPSSEMPSANLTYTQDYGGFIQGIFDFHKFRFNAGIRYDHNSVYGGSFNPRASAIYKLSEKGALKLIYGEAFQEPPPLQLWGGWSGRLANPDLEPEKAYNLEAIAMYRTGPLFHDLSVFGALYDDVIKEEAENAGERTIYGLEYRLKSSLHNFIPRSSDITTYLYYTYTKAKSSIHYNYDTGEWEDGEADLGDISPHKVNIGVNLPVMSGANLFLSGNYVHEQDLYLRNPLRARSKKLDSYLTLNLNIRCMFKPFSISLKILNLLDKNFFHSGVDAADAGDDFEHRSVGWHNSLHPQPGRSFLVNVIIGFQ